MSELVKTMSAKLKQAEARTGFAGMSVQNLQKEVDRLEDELVSEQEKYMAITRAGADLCRDVQVQGAG